MRDQEKRHKDDPDDLRERRAAGIEVDEMWMSGFGSSTLLPSAVRRRSGDVGGSVSRRPEQRCQPPSGQRAPSAGLHRLPRASRVGLEHGPPAPVSGENPGSNVLKVVSRPARFPFSAGFLRAAAHKQPEHQSMRDQEKRHKDDPDEIRGAELAGIEVDAIALIERVDEVRGPPHIENPDHKEPESAPQHRQRQ